MKIRKYRFRILIGLFLLISISLATVFIAGYITASRHTSYLPEFNIHDLESGASGGKIIKLKCSWYELLVDEYGRITVVTLKGEPILSNLKYYSSHEGTTEKWGLNNISVKLINDSTILVTGEVSMKVLVEVMLLVHKDQPKLDVHIKTLYSSTTIVSREALVAAFSLPVTEVFKKNRQIDVKSFNSEYWLQKQGVRFGSGDRSALVYHTPFISSLQLDTNKKLLFFNLDYYSDHPFIHIPFQKNGGGKWVDQSKAKYVAGSERNNSFSINFGGISKINPRFMLVPNGYLAGYVFSEHADGSTIKSNRAVYFGSEDISNIKDAKKGFAGHKIPVTKSVFYTEISNSPQFQDFLDQLQKTGNYDICLHSPEDGNSNRKILEESIKFMKGRYNTSTWIDHGFYSGQINREASVSDGLNPNSEYYAADLWEKYGTRYFWSPADEMINTYSLKEKIKEFEFYDFCVNLWKRYLSPEELKKLSFYESFKEMIERYFEKGETNTLMSYKSDAFPTPLFYQFPTQTKNFNFWITDRAKLVNNLSSKKVQIEKKHLNKLVTDWGIFVNHGYFVRNGNIDDHLNELNGKLVINPYFDQILEAMSLMRNKGDLYTTTIRDLMDYWIRIENISLEYRSNGTIYVCNNNDEQIRGLSLVINSDTIYVNGETPKFRRVGDDTIFWFDISAKGKALLDIR